MNRSKRTLVGLCLALLLCSAAELPAQPRTEYGGAAELGLALRKLGVTKRVLMIAAHPDDESTQILASLALGEGAEVAYLSLTRGEGGQNGIGPELQEALGLLRTEELLSARRLDGARQYFTRANDFGFTRLADETFRYWPRDSLLADVVAVVRDFRPDVIVSVFTGTPLDGHGHHQVAGMMAREAFVAAADAGRYPEQLRRGLRPHRTAVLYGGAWRREGEATHRLQSGDVDPLLGRSHFQIAMASRSRHRSQDMGREETPGPQTSSLQRLAGLETPGPSLWAGVDTVLSQFAPPPRSRPEPVAARLVDYEARVATLRAAYNPFEPGRLVPELAAAVSTLDLAIEEARRLSPRAESELLFRLRAERRDAEAALLLAGGVQLDAVTDVETVVPGQELTVTLRLWNGGTQPIDVLQLAPELPAGWRAVPLDSLPARLEAGALLRRRFRVTLPADARESEPYYLREPRSGEMFRWPAGAAGVGAPFEAPELGSTARLRLAGAELAAEREVSYLGVDKMSGEYRRPVRVVPAVTLSSRPGVLVVPLAGVGAPLRLSVGAAAHQPDGVAGRLSLEVPRGWSAPPPREVRLGAAEERSFEFALTPPAGVAAGQYAVSAVFTTPDGRRYTRGFQLVDYPHIRPRPLYREARSAVTAMDVRVAPGRRVGYIVGAGDETPAALAQLGVDYELLDAPALAAADLSRFDALVVGIRAYEVRPDLAGQSSRLHEYVRQGGTMIVQYNKYEFTEAGIAPYPLAMARPHGRVTDHTAPVRLLEPDHALLSWPNRIGAADFEGWVQERGLYFLSEWDERYTPLLEMTDPGQPVQRGSLVVARHGEGQYVYTGLALFRQLPAGVPGAYRLLANLVSLGAAR
jgi:LmbE family N-acetylglucosaminyl deacetylase